MSSIDMASLLLCAYELGDWINQSAEVAEYQYWNNLVNEDVQVKGLLKRFAKAKELFEECERFGRFHPDYHAAKDAVNLVQQELDELECVARFKHAEDAVDTLLYDVSKMIAQSVSDTIKVPSNDPGVKGGSCGSGGSCSCGSGGCG